MKRNDIRNVAIIAHVDHGKTTLVDNMLRQSGLFRAEELDKLVGGQHGLIMDSNDLERERGITILAKNCAFKIGDVKVNLIDTPGHADFGGEVERILKMADGAFVLVDAAEGPLPQTRFVLRKAFAEGLKPIVVINKIDRPDARPTEVLNAVFDLFIELGADDETADFPIIYASGKKGIASRDKDVPGTDLKPLYDAILQHVPPPEVDPDAPLQMLVLNIMHSEFVGRIGIGRVYAGKVRKGQKVALMKRDGKRVDDTVVQVLEFDRLARVEVPECSAGDICCLVGLDGVDIGDTVCQIDHPVALPPVAIDEPTLDMVFRINDSPFAGQDGHPLTARQLRDRLFKELESNVAMRVRPNPERAEEFIVSGRGLLHLTILLETMRREGSELSVGKPVVITKKVDGVEMEPIEYLVIDVPAQYTSAVMGLVLERQGQCLKMEGGQVSTHLEFTIPARGLIGLRTRMMNATSGNAIVHHNFHEYAPMKGVIEGRASGVMISTETAKATGYAIEGLQERGTLFVAPSEPVYEGQVVGQNARDKDMTVNVTREKKLTNMRASGSEKTVPLKPPRVFSLEDALEYIEDDELAEITPTAVRLRKIMLKENDRKRAERALKGGM
ncbi:MAG: translational GTPase TypA [Gemmataceae bacterium]|nr:translational GTPase TypA [Gemmataceae bacterium]